MNLIKLIDRFLNWITMYKLTLYFLIILVMAAFIGSVLEILSYNPVNILITTVISVSVCFISNLFFSKIFKAITNVESVFITAFIIALLVPINIPNSFIITAFVSFLAMASKYLLTINKRHIFNPAAVGILGVTLLSGESAARWWIGNTFLLPFVVIGGFLIVRKMRRDAMVYAFLGVYILFVCFASFTRNFESVNFLPTTLSSILLTIKQSITQSAILFFATIMLIEPSTSPTSKTKQVYYSILIAFFHATPQLRITNFVFTPEMALCIGNIFSYILNPNYRFLLTLKEKIGLSKDTVLFVFEDISNFKFKAGQYMEWTLPHNNPDNRGNRRYFSLASSPTESAPMLLVKYYDPPSTFKKTLFTLKKGNHIVASQLAGDFVMPEDLSRPLVFIAGGVGISPFRSMIKYIKDQKIKVDITLLFANKTPDDILLQDFLKQAESFGVRTINILTDEKDIPKNWNGEKGHITSEKIKKIVPDFKNKLFFVSGPQLMVQGIEKKLIEMGIPKRNIKTDFFPGYSA